MQIDKVYEPQRFEPHWAQWWIDSGVFRADASAEGHRRSRAACSSVDHRSCPGAEARASLDRLVAHGTKIHGSPPVEWLTARETGSRTRPSKAVYRDGRKKASDLARSVYSVV